MIGPDPFASKDLAQLSSDELREWLSTERDVVRDFFSRPIVGKAAERAAWARDRVTRIEGELARRSGRQRRQGG